MDPNNQNPVMPNPDMQMPTASPEGGVSQPVNVAPSNPTPSIVTPSEGTTVTSGTSRPSGGIPGIVKILGILGVVVLIGFLVFRFLIPMLGGNKPKEVSLIWWGLWEEESVVSPLIAEYNSSHPNVQIQYVKQSKEDYRERLTNALARGEGAPDIFTFHNTWVPMFRSNLDTLPETVMSSAEFSQTFYPIVSSDLRGANGFVGIPMGFDTLALFINQDIFQTYGKAIPKTWDEVRQTALDLTIKNEAGEIQQAGIALGRTENVDHWPEIIGLMLLQSNVNLVNPVGEAAETALSFFSLFSTADQVWNQSLPPSTAAFASGKLAMYFGPSWRIFEIREMNPALKFSVVAVPQLPKDPPSAPDTTYATYWANGVASQSKGKEASWDFLKFLSSQESLEKLYQNASQLRTYGEPYPRVDMANLLATDPIMGAFISQAPFAKSFYLASRTFDGPTGINSQITKYYEDALNSVILGGQPGTSLATVASGISQVLSQYGLNQSSP